MITDRCMPQRTSKMLNLSRVSEIQIAGKLNTIIRETGLRELGQLEQDLVFGDAGGKEVINFLRKNQVILSNV